jgi:tRNA pseudouridine synthase 9
MTTINGRIAKPDTVIRDGDRIEYGPAFFPQFHPQAIPHRNVVHRHEPPVTSQRIKILHHDVEREFIVIDKPGSIVCSAITHTLVINNFLFQPVHASGRYHKNSLIEILVGELGYEKVYRTFRRAANCLT